MKRAGVSWINYLLPRLSDALFVALLAGLMTIAPRLLNQDGDTGRHLAVGRTILASGQIPRADIFSHTMSGQPLAPHEWLAQVLFALANQVLGLSGVTLLTALVLAAAFRLVYAEARRRSGLPLLSLLITLLGLAAASIHFLARPHIFTILFVTLWLTLLERMREGRPLSPFWLGLVMLVWANLHGAFIAGFCDLGCLSGGNFMGRCQRQTFPPLTAQPHLAHRRRSSAGRLPAQPGWNGGLENRI